jgi:hypothetical protein
MKLQIISDLHLEFAPWYVPEWDEDTDLYINAGDIHPSPLMQKWFDAQWPRDRYFRIWGNHDYWGNDIDQYTSAYTRNVKGLKIAGATLWTDLDQDPNGYFIWQLNLRDYEHMQEMSEQRYREIYESHKHFLLTSEADIIVTHHGPSYLSVHDQYKGDVSNFCFVTELGHEILNMKKPPKLWVHGHVHNSFDYMIGDTRVVCHPRGYPWEPNHKNYETKVIEL